MSFESQYINMRLPVLNIDALGPISHRF